MKRRDGQPNRAEQREQRSETFWARQRAGASTGGELLAVEFGRLKARINRLPIEQQDRTRADVAQKIRQIGDYL